MAQHRWNRRFLQDAEAALLQELEALGLHPEIEIAGEFTHAAKCTITEKGTGKFLASGNGKGELTASRVGSLFEATEHLLSHYHALDPDKYWSLVRGTMEAARPNFDVVSSWMETSEVFNPKARRKFLRSSGTEAGRIVQCADYHH